MNNGIDLQTPDKAKIEEIIKIEWQMFQNVDNLGGRADCQDDFETFYIMRRSQYDNWTEEMVRVYGDFAAKSLKEGRNLISEKYARMMAYTDLHYFNKHLKDKLPTVPMINYRIISGIVEKLILWEEDMAKRYPKLAGTARRSGLRRINTDLLPWRLMPEENLRHIRRSCYPYMPNMSINCRKRGFLYPRKILIPWSQCMVIKV